MDRINIQLPQVNSERWLSLEDFEGEIWKPIEGYEDYHISNYGRVKTFKKKGNAIEGKMRSLFEAKKGYYVLRLFKDGKYKHHQVHRLVANAFIPNPNNEACVNHKDENPKNNKVENLEWCSFLYNRRYGTAIERSNRGKYKKVKGVSLDGSKTVYYDGMVEAERLSNGFFKKQNISQCLNNRQKTHNGFKWYYNE